MVSAKAKATVDVNISTFEGELDGHAYGLDDNKDKSFMIAGLFEAYKQAATVMNILMELKEYPAERNLFADNEAMINFVNGEANGKGMKHAALRLWYVRQQKDRGYKLTWMSGLEIVANGLTKALHQAEFEAFVKDIQGHRLLE